VLRRWAASRLLRAALERDMAGQRGPAIDLYRAAVASWPEDVMAQVDLAEVLAQSGASLEAMQHAFAAVRANPDSGSARHIYGRLLASVGNHEQAMQQLREAERIEPDAADVHNDLGQSLAIAGKAGEALLELREAMRLQPQWPVPLSGAALLLATHPDARARDSAEAIALAQRAAKLTRRKDPGALQILAVCYAAAGRFDDAVATQQAVVELASASGDKRLAAEAQAGLARYQKHEN
jgi:Flp pilus assembly protein TadD